MDFKLCLKSIDLWYMKHSIGFIITAILLLQFQSCKTKEEAAPDIKIGAVQLLINEGDTLLFTNNSTHVSKSNWSCDKLGFSSTELAPTLVIKDSGVYQFHYAGTNGDGISNSADLQITVLPDTVFRLSNNGTKIWIIQSIIYNNTEMVTNNCQKDDEFTVYHGSSDTCTLTNGKDTCPPGTYIFELPATSQWRWNSARNTFEFALTAFGSPVNLSFKPKTCTRQTFDGEDAFNGVRIKLQEKI